MRWAPHSPGLCPWEGETVYWPLKFCASFSQYRIVAKKQLQSQKLLFLCPCHMGGRRGLHKTNQAKAMWAEVVCHLPAEAGGDVSEQKSRSRGFLGVSFPTAGWMEKSPRSYEVEKKQTNLGPGMSTWKLYISIVGDMVRNIRPRRFGGTFMKAIRIIITSAFLYNKTPFTPINLFDQQFIIKRLSFEGKWSLVWK